MIDTIKNNWGTMVGCLSVAIVPLAFLDRVHRFVLLPQLGIALLGILAGYLCWVRFGAIRRFGVEVYLGTAFLLLQCLSVLFAHTPSLSVLPVLTDFGFVSILILVVVGFTRDDIDRTIAGTAAVSGVVSAIGLLQYLDVGRSLIPTAGLPSATLGHRNIAAAYIGGAFPLVVNRIWVSREGLRSWLWTLSGALGLSFMIATRSRAGWLSLLVATCVASLLWHRGRSSGVFPGFGSGKRYALVAGLILVGLVSLVPADIGKGDGEAMWHEKASVVQTIRSFSASGGDKGRLILWDTTLKMIRNQPIIGVGPGNWRIQYPVQADGRMIDANSAPHRAHNDLLTIWSEGGVAPLLLFLALICLSFRRAWTAAAGDDSLIALSVASSAAGLLCSGLFGFPREFIGASAPLWFGFGVLSVLTGGASSTERAPRWPAVPGALVAIAGLLACVQLIDHDKSVVRARIAAALSDWQGVLEATDHLKTSSWSDEQVFLLRGNAFEQTGRPREAVSSYDFALRIHPNAAELWLGLGVAQRAAGDPEAAAGSFRKAIDLDPQDGRALGNLGTLMASRGQLEAAVELLEQAVTAENTPADVYASLSTVYRRSGDAARAVAIARTGMALEQSADIANALGNALAASGDHQEAIATFRTGLRQSPGHIQLLYNLARSLESVNRTDEAISTYREVIDRIGTRYSDRRSHIERRVAQLERGRD